MLENVNSTLAASSMQDGAMLAAITNPYEVVFITNLV
jgi:hypothetical protein